MNENIYLIPVWDTITTAWQKVCGAKKTIWAALGVMFLIMLGIGIVAGISRWINSGLSDLIKMIGGLVNYLLQFGVLYIGICRAKDLSIRFTQMFKVFELRMALNIIGLFLLELLIFTPFIALSFLLPILFGVMLAGIFHLAIGCLLLFITIRLSLSTAMVLDQNVSPWRAIQQSFQATRQNFWRLLAIFLIQAGILIVSIIPLGIGLIWSLPFAVICYGVMYQRLWANLK